MGVKYESRVHRYLLTQYGFERYLPSMWFAYFAGEKVRYAQTDGLLFLDNPERCIVVEVKYQHTPEAWEQAWGRYVPLLTNFFARRIPVLGLQVCKWFDPAVKVPVSVHLTPRPESARMNAFNTMILNRELD